MTKLIKFSEFQDTTKKPLMSHEQFAETTGKQEGNVRRTMNTLKDKGIIRVITYLTSLLMFILLIPKSLISWNLI